MRILIVVTALLSLAACTAMMAGGGYQPEKRERSAGVAVSDSAITGKIKSKYAADSVVSPFDVGVRTWAGAVTLSGTVGSFDARDRAESIAKSTGGVKAVNNYLQVEDRSVQ